MIWLYILLDIVLLLALVLLVLLLIRLWTKKKRLHHGAIAQFRNREIYEQSAKEQQRLAHIEQALPQKDALKTGEQEEEISFTTGYGGEAELEGTSGN